MELSRHIRKLSLLEVTSLLAMILALAACGGGTASTASAPKAVATTPPTSTPVPATATVSALSKMITQVGQPKAKMLTGATFEVNGQIKNTAGMAERAGDGNQGERKYRRHRPGLTILM